jgi:hypothetical protein
MIVGKSKGRVGMKFFEIANRLTGISTPIIGVSWQPTGSETAATRRVVAFLEDRRVLYYPGEMEVPVHCVSSVMQIRRFLTAEIGRLGRKSELGASLRAMQAACRKFLDAVGGEDSEILLHAREPGHYAGWTFYGALGEMRGVFGIHLARIATRFQVDVEDELAAIIPLAPDDDSDDPFRDSSKQMKALRKAGKE